MAVDQGTVSKTLTLKERTKEITIFSAFGKDPEIGIYRERVEINPDGTLNKAVDLPCVEVRGSQVASQTAADTSGAQLAADLSAWGDFLATAKANGTAPFAPSET